MLDIRKVRADPQGVEAALRRRDPSLGLAEVLAADAAWRELQGRIGEANQRRNVISQEVQARKKSGQDAGEAIQRGRSLGDELRELEAREREASAALDALLLHLPNLPDPSVPDGRDSSANPVVRTFGAPREFPFPARGHYEIAEALRLLDFARGVKLAGHGFMLFTGAGARLVRALLSFMLDLHTRSGKYREVYPPFLASRACMEGTGQLPRLEKDMYRLPEEDFFLIPTAEVPLTNLHQGETLSAKDLPIRLTAFTACFRREAGTWGKDVRGLTRVHQFDKVELVKIVHPDRSGEELEDLAADAERVLQTLGLHYRVSLLCAGDLSFSAAKCYDLEVHAPGAGRYLEVSSCSSFGEFQARRARLKFRDEDGKTRFVHTLNGSGVAVPRLFIALLEQGQQEDGTVLLPEALAPYLDGKRRITARGLE